MYVLWVPLFMLHSMCLPNSLYRSHAGRHFNETENVIWAGFGPIGSTAQPNLLLGTTFDGIFYMFFWAILF